MIKKLKATFCIWFGHSNIEAGSWGYHYCARCDVLLGDSLAGAYENLDQIDLNCGCRGRCRPNWKKATWRDKFLTPKPEWVK